MLVLHLPCKCLLLRKELPDRDVELRLRLQDACGGNLQRKVVVVGGVDEAVERRVVEQLPPVGSMWWLGRAAGRLTNPVLRDRRCGSMEVRPHLAAARSQHGAGHRQRELCRGTPSPVCHGRYPF